MLDGKAKMENKPSIITKESKLFGQIRFVFVDERVYAVAYDVLKATRYSEGALRTISSIKCKRFKGQKIYKFNDSEFNFVNLFSTGRLAELSKLSESEKNQFEYWVIDVLSQIKKSYTMLRKKLDIHYTEFSLSIKENPKRV